MPQGTTTYAWDYENRLTSVTLPDQSQVTFKYDPFGRRIQKVSMAGTTNYAYDGANVVEEVDGLGTVIARYAQGAGIDEPLDESTGGATSFYAADGLGSITSLASGGGALTDTYVRDAFGNSTTSTGTTRNPYRYTGRDFDSETGLYYYRARYYDSSTGRFISEDEIGNDEGLDLYVYVKNSSLNYRDPTGFYKLKGFPPAREQQMRDAIQEAINKLGSGCNGCAGAAGPKIVQALQTATFVYKPDLSYCGYANEFPLFRHIEVGEISFDSKTCCTLASTLAHEASHLGAHTSDKDKPGSAYDIEKKCFNCGTGHPPANAH